MLKRLHYISVQLAALLLALSCGLAVCGCSSDPDGPQPGPDPAREVVGTLGFYINMGDTFGTSRSGTSRTPTDGPYDPGAGYENYIDIDGHDIHIYAFTAASATDNRGSDKLYQEITDITVVPIDPYESDPTVIKRYYYVTFPVTREFKDHFETNSLKLVMLANWGEYPDVAARPTASGSSTAAETTELQPDVATIEDLVTKSDAAVMDYDYNSPVTPSTLGLGEGKHLIPLFGVKDFGTVKDLVSGSAKWLGTLNLLRALAKVEVYDADENYMSYPIKSVTITCYNKQVAKAPANVFDEGDYVKGSYAGDYCDITVDPKKEASNQISITPVKVKHSDGSERNHYIVYVPEYRNIIDNNPQEPRDGVERMRLNVKFADGKDNYIDFAEYKFSFETHKSEITKYHNVCRNYWYKFEISKNIIIADIQPYSEVKLEPPFGLDRDNEGNIIVERYDDGTYKVMDGTTGIWKDADGDVVLKKFEDGSFLCVETIYKDYIHDEHETDHIFPFEKDYSGGNMVIIREKSAGGAFHGGNDDELISDTHTHGLDDRPLFVLDKKGDFHRVEYDSEGKASLKDTDVKGDKIIQVNGFQFRNKNEMRKYIGSYVVELSDGTEQLRYYKDGSELNWDDGVPESKQS